MKTTNTATGARDVRAAVGDLVAVLHEQLTVVAQLVATVEAERHAVTAHDLTALGAAVGEKAALVGRLEQLERRRVDLTTTLAAALGVAPAEATLRQLVVQIAAVGAGSEPVLVELESVHEQLAERMLHLATLNKRNRLLIVSLLGLVQQARTFLTRLTHGDDDTGKPPRPRALSSALDVRI